MAKFNAPICPGCGKPLKLAWGTEEITYKFNKETGKYELRNFLGAETRTVCPNCLNSVGYELFEDGILNYQAKRKESDYEMSKEQEKYFEPIGKKGATTLLKIGKLLGSSGVQIYKIYEDGTEALVEGLDDLESWNGKLGLQK